MLPKKWNLVTQKMTSLAVSYELMLLYQQELDWHLGVAVSHWWSNTWLVVKTAQANVKASCPKSVLTPKISLLIQLAHQGIQGHLQLMSYKLLIIILLNLLTSYKLRPTSLSISKVIY